MSKPTQTAPPLDSTLPSSCASTASITLGRECVCTTAGVAFVKNRTLLADFCLLTFSSAFCEFVATFSGPEVRSLADCLSTLARSRKEVTGKPNVDRLPNCKSSGAAQGVREKLPPVQRCRELTRKSPLRVGDSSPLPKEPLYEALVSRVLTLLPLCVSVGFSAVMRRATAYSRRRHRTYITVFCAAWYSSDNRVRCPATHSIQTTRPDPSTSSQGVLRMTAL